MKRWKFLLLAASFLAVSSQASGQTHESRARAAKKACLLGEVDKGAEILADLYIETNDATYIYNQGRCFEQNGKNTQAVLRFKEYLRKANNLKPVDQETIQKKIETLQESIDKSESKAAAAKPSTEPTGPRPLQPAPPAATATPSSDPLGVSQTAAVPEPQESPAVYERWWFWTGVGAVVVGGVVTGVLLSRQSAPKSPPCDGVGACVP